MHSRFTEALMAEIEACGRWWNRPSVATVYFGGGTPSFLPIEYWVRIMTSMRNRFDLSGTVEITLEANPNHVDEDNIRRWAGLGINRLSIGVQSFRDDELRFLTRTHTGVEAREAVKRARQQFKNVSLDLIFGLPGQQLGHWMESLDVALELAPEHLSIYNLTVEERTHLHKMVLRGQVPARDEELELAMYVQTIDLLSKAGYEHYEISNYARPGFESLHNRAYWTGRPYLGMGPSAHSYFEGRRWWNVRNLESYCRHLTEHASLPIEGSEELTAEQQCEEYILLGLRQQVGMRISELERLGGFRFHERLEEPIEKLQPYCVVEGDSLRLTDEGSFLYNRICRELISAL